MPYIGPRVIREINMQMTQSLAEALPTAKDHVMAKVDPVRPMVSIRNLTKNFGAISALSDINLDVARGEVLVLLGPSGCGKTTLLRCVAGLEHPTSGQIRVHDNEVFSSEKDLVVPPEKRNLSMVFQSYALWPHMSVTDNIAYPLKVSKVAKAEIEERVKDILDVTRLEKFAEKFPGQLSGGQQQRVALARALVANDGLILFDEPLSNLDAKVREHLRDELTEMQQRFNFTSIYVTHDQVEAAALADRIAVMEVGKVAQLGTPLEIFNEPNTAYVADFVGCSNQVTGKIAAASKGILRVETAMGTFEGTTSDTALGVGDTAIVMFRPEHVRIDEALSAKSNSFNAKVDRSIFLGSHVENIMHVNGQRVAARSMQSGMIAAGTHVGISVDAKDLRIFRGNTSH